MQNHYPSAQAALFLFTTFHAAAEAAQQAKRPATQQRIGQGATTFSTACASRLTHRSCPNAAPQARSEFCGAQAAQHAFFASFLARARKGVARRGETRPTALKTKNKTSHGNPCVLTQSLHTRLKAPRYLLGHT